MAGESNMKRSGIFLASLLALGSLLSGCRHTNFSFPENSPSVSRTLFQLEAGLTGDSKLYLDKIAATVGGHLAFYDKTGKLLQDYPEIFANWIYAVPDYGIIVAANANNEIRIIQLSDDLSVVKDSLIRSSQSLMIDPTLLHTDDGWYLTFTEIEGTVNNADPHAQNGFYSIHCFKSSDLLNWTQLPDIVSGQNNLEDGDMLERDNILYYFFEREVYDKGPSSLHVISSTDNGNSWGNEKELISANADNELAAVFPQKEGWQLYYSSDKQNPGESYDGASCYLAQFNTAFTNKTDEILMDLGEDSGILLYDISIQENQILFLYVKNYITENRLTLKELSST